MLALLGNIFSNSESELHEAIESVLNGDKQAYEKVEKLCCEKSYLLKQYHGNITPLHKCLLNKNAALTILLLKYSADPNDEFKIKLWQDKKPIQVYIDLNNFSIFRLLAIYGANEDNIIFSDKESCNSQEYSKAKAIYDLKQELKSRIDIFVSSSSSSEIDLLKPIENICNDLCAKFEALAHEEKNNTIQEHYFEEAERFRQLPQLLQEEFVKYKSPHEYSFFNVHSPKSKWSLYDTLMLLSVPSLLNTQQYNLLSKKYQ